MTAAYAKTEFAPARVNGAKALSARALSPAADSRDHDLLARIAAGDKAAMHTLYSRERLRVYRFVLRIVRNPTVAEDLLSDVFLEVWNKAGTFEGRSAISTWILGIARFKALSALRRKSGVELDDTLVATLRDPSDDPEDIVSKQNTGDALRRCIGQLSAKHAEIVDLVYYHEKSVAEVAGIVGIPENTVRTRMFFARKRLAELLKAEGIEHA
jgi:RNA polymerase sigma-70 factor (ECF subfamily)